MFLHFQWLSYQLRLALVLSPPPLEGSCPPSLSRSLQCDILGFTRNSRNPDDTLWTSSKSFLSPVWQISQVKFNSKLKVSNGDRAKCVYDFLDRPEVLESSGTESLLAPELRRRQTLAASRTSTASAAQVPGSRPL